MERRPDETESKPNGTERMRQRNKTGPNIISSVRAAKNASLCVLVMVTPGYGLAHTGFFGVGSLMVWWPLPPFVPPQLYVAIRCRLFGGGACARILAAMCHSHCDATFAFISSLPSPRCWAAFVVCDTHAPWGSPVKDRRSDTIA